MSFYIFKLMHFQVISPRSKRLDMDVVTFSVRINGLDRGHGTGVFSSLAASDTPIRVSAVPAQNRRFMTAFWEIGPFEIRPGDAIDVVYTGTNIGDNGSLALETAQQDEIQLAILSALLVGAAGGVGGALATVLGGILGAIGDPVATLLGFEPAERCNGLVFSDVVSFNGAGLDRLEMGPQAAIGDIVGVDHRAGRSFTRSYINETSADKCGGPANTDVTFRIIRVPSVSVRSLMTLHIPHFSTPSGLRQFGSRSVKSLVGVTP